MHTPRGHQPAEPAPARVTLVPVAVILACAVGGAGTLWSVRDQLPARIVRHWGADGRPDGYATLNEMLATGVAFTLLMPLAMLGLGLAMRQARVLGPVAGGLAAFLAIVLFGGAFTQRGIADGSGIAVSPPLWLGYGAGLAVGVLLWAALGRRTRLDADPRLPLPESAPVLAASDSERIAWTGGTVRLRGRFVLIAVGCVLVAASLAAGVATGALSLWLPTAAVFAVIVGLLTAMLDARVIVDARGVRARGLGVLPLVTVPLTVIENATVARVDPLAEFGGWGLRGGFDGSWGIVTAKGEALRLERAGDSPYFFTVTDAAGAAAAVNTLIGRRSGVGENRSNP